MDPGGVESRAVLVRRPFVVELSIKTLLETSADQRTLLDPCSQSTPSFRIAKTNPWMLSTILRFTIGRYTRSSSLVNPD